MGMSSDIYIGPAVIVKNFDLDRFEEFEEDINSVLRYHGEYSKDYTVFIPNSRKIGFYEECSRASQFTFYLGSQSVNDGIEDFSHIYSDALKILGGYCESFSIKFTVKAYAS